MTPKASKGYKTAVQRYIIPYFAMKYIRHLRYNDIMGFKNWLSKEKELSAKTSYNIINVLKKLLRDAWRNEDIAYNAITKEGDDE